MRRTQSLSGNWEFGIDKDGVNTPTSLELDRQIKVPLPWQAAFPDLEHYSGYAWYRRELDLDTDWIGGELLLRFGAVDYWCRVFINEELAGEHEGGYTPFTIRAGAYLHEGRNGLVVQVYDVAQESIVVPRWPADTSANSQSAIDDAPPFDANDIPHGKQEWYMNVGGIWQDVTLTSVPSTWIDHVQVTTDIRSGLARVRVELGGEGQRGRLQVRISPADGQGEAPEAALVELTAEENSYELAVQVQQPHIWSTDDPFLYVAEVSLEIDIQPTDNRQVFGLRPIQANDSLAVRFGFREISASDGRLLLNGEPIFLRAALDQDIYPETIYTVPSEEFLRDEFRKAKQLGLNCLRCHIKPPDPIYLDLADEMGLLVWTEVPSWRTFHLKATLQGERLNLDDAVKQRVERTLEEMLRRDINHPSIIIWTLVNEDWGTSLPLSAADREWVAGLYDRCKELDPARLVVDNSACPHPWGPNVHVKSDIDDFHIYANIPEQWHSFARAIDQFSQRPLWTYSNHGDAQRTGHEPLILSEFGNWGLAEMESLRASASRQSTTPKPTIGVPSGQAQSAIGDEPDWFNLRPWWNSWEGEAGWPAGVEERFSRFGLDRIWPTYDAFARATQWHQFRALKFEIETMRHHQSLAGYVITELSDIYWETNGLLDFYRNPKAYHEVFAKINSADMIIPQISDYACWDKHPEGTRPAVHLHASRYGSEDWSDACLHWSVAGEDKGEARIAALERGEVRNLGFITLDFPRVKYAGSVPVDISVRGSGGKTLAQNSLDLFLVPSEWQRVRSEIPIAVVASDPYARTLPIEPLARPPEGLDVAQSDERLVAGHTESQEEPASIHLAHELQRKVHELGYQTTAQLTAETRIVVTSRPDAAVLKWVRAGGDMLYLANGPGPFFWVQDRGGPYSGSWLTSFSWIDPSVHKHLAAVGNPIGMPFLHIMPWRTILGLPVEQKAIQGDLLAGMVSGWVGHPATHTVQFRYGKGKVIMTTFGIEQCLPHDPMAVAMFHDLIDHLTSGACDPVLNANW